MNQPNIEQIESAVATSLHARTRSSGTSAPVT